MLAESVPLILFWGLALIGAGMAALVAWPILTWLLSGREKTSVATPVTPWLEERRSTVDEERRPIRQAVGDDDKARKLQAIRAGFRIGADGSVTLAGLDFLFLLSELERLREVRA